MCVCGGGGGSFDPSLVFRSMAGQCTQGVAFVLDVAFFSIYLFILLFFLWFTFYFPGFCCLIQTGARPHWQADNVASGGCHSARHL